MNESWLSVVGFEGVYSVSDLGRVRRDAPENNTFSGRILRPDFPAGYMQFSLYRQGIKHRFKGHQLVAAAFIGPCPKGYQINHKDGIKINNVPSNLEYVTGLENHQHAARIGLKPAGERNGLAKLTNEAVRYIRKYHVPKTRGKGCYILARKFGVSATTISAVVNGKTWLRVTS